MSTSVVDFETDKIENRPAYPPKPAGVAIRWPSGDREYLAWGHPTQNNCDISTARAKLKDAYRAKRVIFHHSAFDIDVGECHLGVKPTGRVDDTLFLGFLKDPYTPELALKPLAERDLGMPPTEQDQLKDWILGNVKGATEKKWGEHISKAPGKLVGKYAIGDVTRTYKLYNKYVPEIKERGMWDAYERELACAPISMEMERSGVNVDRKRLLECRDVFETLDRDMLRAIAKRLRIDYKKLKSEENPKGFNLNSSQQLADAMKRADKFDSIVKTPSGQICTKMEVLRETCNDKRLLNLLGIHSVAEKYLTSFIRPWLLQSYITDGRILPKFNQVRGYDQGGGGARTGRFCVHGDTLIDTSRGTFRIADYAPQTGDTVLTHLGNRRQVLRKFYKGVEPMLRVELETGAYIVGTRNHRILTTTGWIKLGELTRDSQVKTDATVKQTCSKLVHRQGQANNTSGSRQVRSSLECSAQSARRQPLTETVEAREGYPILSIQTGQAQSYAGQQWASTSKVQGLDRRRAWGMADQVLRQVHIASPVHDVESAWTEEAAKRIRGAPHRRQSQTRQAIKPCSRDKGRSHGTSRYPSWQLTEVKKIEAVEPSDVWDIEVEGDHSYAAQGMMHHNSSSEPNLQNVSANIEESKNRELLMFMQQFLRDKYDYEFIGLRDFIVPDEGKIIVGCDYDQQELRILAHFEKGVLMREYLRNPKLDVHDFVRRLIYDATGLEFFSDKNAKTARKFVKITVFGIVYGMGIDKLARQLDISKDMAKTVRDGVLDTVPGIPRIMRELKRLDNHGKPMRTWGGREYFAEEPHYVKKHNRVMEFGYRLFNYKIQGSAADVTKQGMINVNEQVPEVRIAVQVHDELLIMAPSAKYGPRIARAMCDMRFRVPMTATAKYSKESWARLKEAA